MHFILPKYDECAKELFGNEFILKYFLSDLLGIHAEDIRSLKFLNPFLKGVTAAGNLEYWISLLK